MLPHRKSPNPAAVAALLSALILTGMPATARADDAIDVKIAPLTIAPGQMLEASITIVIHENYRLIGDPPPNKFSVPLMVTFDASRALQPRAAVIPPPRKFEEAQFSYSAHEGTIVVKMPIKADEHAGPGDYAVHGRIRYQPLIIENGLAGFLKTTVKLVDLTVHVTAAKPKGATQAPATPR